MWKSLETTEQWIARGLLVVIVALVFVASIARWLRHPIPWSVDMAQLLFIWLCFLGANQALRRGEHIGVDLLARRLPAGMQTALDIGFTVLALALMIVLIVLGIDLTYLNRERLFSDSNLSYAYVTAAVPAGCALLSLTLLRRLIGLVRGRGPAGRAPGGGQRL